MIGLKKYQQASVLFFPYTRPFFRADNFEIYPSEMCIYTTIQWDYTELCIFAQNVEKIKE